MMMMKCLILCLLVLKSLKAEDAVSYYENLIDTQQNKALNSVPVQSASEFETPPMKPIMYGIYNYIIVGAGSAGAVVAARLTEDEQVTVLLLEAGGEESDFTDIPSMLQYLQGLEYNWMYNTTPQTGVCNAMINNECAFPRGKSLGGTSTINAIMYVRGNRLDYDNWNRKNPGWSYDEVLPLFIKSENSSIDGDPGYHGTQGELHVQYHKPNSVQYQAFIDANLERGRKVVDYNGREQFGVAPVQMTMNHGRRDSTGRAFIQKISKRKNLTILTHSLALKVLIYSCLKRAHGVLFSYNGKLYNAEARGEVVLSAGTIGSPQLLMLSGVGPKQHLQELGIPVIKDLPVGNNFHDHPNFYGFRVKTNYTEPGASLEQNIKQYLNGYGPFAAGGNSQGLGFYRTKYNNSTRPDIELIMIPSKNTDSMTQKAYHYTDEAFEALSYDADPNRTFSVYIILLTPRSRGTVRLRSKNPYKYPIIDPRTLTDPRDVAVMYEGIQIALDLLNTAAFRKLNAALTSKPQPQCRGLQYLSRAFWYCQIRALTAHIYHPVGTCKMGPDSRQAVVDHELKVHGIDRLRVADASIIPEIVAGHTNAPAIMIGEKVSNLIKGTNR